MKKIGFLFMLTISLITTQIATASVTATVSAIAAAVRVGLEVYKSLPDASYALVIEAKDGSVTYSKVDSCDEALSYALKLLENGVREVRIVSEHTTVNGSCRGRSYTSSDIPFLRNKTN